MHIDRVLFHPFTVVASTLLLAVGIAWGTLYFKSLIMLWIGICIVQYFYVYLPLLAILVRILYYRARRLAIIVGIVGTALFLAGIPLYLGYLAIIYSPY